MSEARKNGTKPKIAPFRLSTKPTIKDAPIFEDVTFTKKKKPIRKLSASKADENAKIPVKVDQSETPGTFGRKTTDTSKKSPGGFTKDFGDPFKYKVADPFAIMTAEPDEDEPVEEPAVTDDEKSTVVSKEESDQTAENDQAAENEPADSTLVKSEESVEVETADKESGETSEKLEMNEANDSAQLEADETNVESIESGKIDEGDQVYHREEDILEINADIDSSTLKDSDDVLDDVLTKQNNDMTEGKHDEKDKRHKKRKKSEKHGKSEKHDKGEKKKKRRKERDKSEDENPDKRHKKHRRDNRSRSRHRSRSRSSSKKRREHPHKSRDDTPNKPRRQSNRRDSPERFDSFHKSRSRSPIQRARSRGPDRISSSPKRKALERSPPRQKPRVAMSQPEKSVKLITPREISPRRLNKRGKSKTPEAPEERQPINRSPKRRRKSREEKSPRKSCGSRSPVDLQRKKADGNNSSSSAQTPAVMSGERQKEPCAKDSNFKESDKSISSNGKKSPNSKTQLKSYVQIVPKNQAPPPARIVPYDDDVMSISPRDNTDDGLSIQSENKMVNAQETESQKVYKSKELKHKENDVAEPGKKLKVKKKSKKGQEKKRKKKALAKSEALENVEKNIDDELEDLLFTKTNKESKEEDVFNVSDVFSAKHNLHTAVVDVDRKKLKTVDSPVRKEPPDGRGLSPLRKDPAKGKKVDQMNEEVMESKVLSSGVVTEDSYELYEPERLSEKNESEVLPETEQPGLDLPPVTTGFSTIPFLSHDEKQEGVIDGEFFKNDHMEQTFESENEPYSPVEENADCDMISYSPIEETVSDFGSPKKSSTMNLSDISTKDTVFENTVGVVTTAEKVEDFLGSIQPPDQGVQQMSSPTNGLGANSDDNNDDIIEQLHKEFVRTQHNKDIQPGFYRDNHVSETSSLPQVPKHRSSSAIPLTTAASDPIVQAYGLNKDLGTSLKTKRSKRSKEDKSKKSGKEENKPLAKDKKVIEDALNRVHRQARVEDEMKHALKVYFKRKDITKDEYKKILRKGVPQVANSNHTIDPERIRSLVKKYVAKYKGSRERSSKLDPKGQQEIPFTFSP